MRILTSSSACNVCGFSFARLCDFLLCAINTADPTAGRATTRISTESHKLLPLKKINGNTIRLITIRVREATTEIPSTAAFDGDPFAMHLAMHEDFPISTAILGVASTVVSTSRYIIALAKETFVKRTRVSLAE